MANIVKAEVEAACQQGNVGYRLLSDTEAQNRQIRITDEDDPTFNDFIIEIVASTPDTREKMNSINLYMTPIIPEVERADRIMFYVTPVPSDRVLKAWAKSLIHSVLFNDSGSIEDAKNALMEDISIQEDNAYFRWRNGHGDEETFNKWQKLRTFVLEGFPDSTFSSDKVKVFRLNYGRYIDDMDTFLESLKTIKGKRLKAFFNKFFARSNVTFKEFFDDCATLVPERKDEKGWSYESARRRKGH